MKYQITSDNISVSESMEFLAKEKFTKIDSRLDHVEESSKSIRIVINSAPDGKFTVKGEVLADGKTFFASETDFSVEGALLKTVEELLKKIEKGKAKRSSQNEEGWKVIREAKRQIDEE
jgi:ribosome-associated translation inhibitor RaiA